MGSVGANVQVTATFPSTMTGTCGTTATISFPSYGIYSGFHLETNSYFDPHIANTFTLNSIGVATLRLGYAFVIPAAASFLGETFTAQVTFTVDGISTISTITITASPGGCGTCIKPPQGMVAWWSGDGNADDISDGTNDGILRNGVTYSSGKVSQTFTFDGVDDYVEIPNHSSLNFGTGDFSFDAWVQTTDAAGVDVIQDKREGGSVGDPGYHVHLYNGTPSILIGDATDYSTFISGVSVADGNWHHIAITVERANPAGLKFYIDGALVSTKNPTARNGSVSNNAVFTIGSRSFQNSGNFNGSIDEVEVFNRALTACQVNALYLADTLGKCKPSSGTSVAGGKVTLESGLLSLSAFQKNSPSMPFKQGDPIRDVEVSLGKKPSGTVMFTQSDDSGKFFFMGLEPGEYELKVTPPAGAVVAYPPEGTYTFTLSEGDTISDFEFRLMLTPPDSYWRIIPSGTTVNLNAVGFFDENIAVAVGDSNTILRSTDGGVTWNPAEIDTVAGVSKLFRGGGDPMKGLNISKPSGGGGTVGPCGKKAICVGGGGKILETTDFGQSWHFMNSGTLSTLHGITSVSITNFVAVGENLTMLYSSNSGDSWLPSTIISPPQISSKMMGNTVKNTFDGNRYYCDTCCPHMSKQLTNPFEANLIAVGESGLIFTSSDMGVTWMYQTPFTSQSLNSGVGFPGNHSFVAGDALFLQSTDNGFSWSVTTDTEETIRSVISVGSSSAYAVGDNGRIIFSSDQGTSWSTEVSPSTNDLLGVASEDFSDGFARIVLAVGEGGLIMRKIEQIGEAVNIPTEDGWNLVSVPVEPAEYATDTLFRFAASSAFSYDNGYVSEDSLTPGKGYWLKFNGTSAAGMIGSSITAETVDVKARWNLVGSITEEISTSFVTSIPPGLVTSN
ncbi:MAG: hypothetical protein HYZ33_02115, partial [Ignavibacteriales bacterium]|nr:hypothetical protein [Ignavibacteriales bacterium]